VAAGEEADEQALDHVFLADDPLADLRHDVADESGISRG
jgi:hypothetical protein